MMTCRQLTELVTDYAEKRLPLLLRLRFLLHMKVCGACRCYLRQMEATVRALQALPADDALPPKAESELMDCFERWKAGTLK